MVNKMAKKQLNKMVLLPLFLAGVTLASAGVLTGVHLLTAPLIERNELNKKYEGYKTILAIDTFDEVRELTLPPPLSEAGVTLKQSFIVGGTSAGVVYDGSITGWNSGLVFQVGFKGDVYAGFNLISSNETPGIGADYLKLVNDRIKGKNISEPVLIDDDGTYTGVTAPITGSPLKLVLEMCAADYGGEEVVEPEHDPAALSDLNTALNIDNASAFTSLALTDDLRAVDVVYKYDVHAGEESVGIVYEVKTRGFKPDLQFLVGFADGKFAGFYVLKSSESDGWGADYLVLVNDAIVGLDATQPFAILPDHAGITKTRDAVENALRAAALDYVGGLA